MSSDRIERHTAGRVRFIGEQVGAAEQALKERVTPLLRASGSIRRAYLARVEYGSVVPAVALCLRGDNVDSGLLGEIGAVFAPMFSKEAHLDLIIVDEEQEDELAKVCRPFWELA